MPQQATGHFLAFTETAQTIISNRAVNFLKIFLFLLIIMNSVPCEDEDIVTAAWQT